jgi:hypothetical protein
MIYNEFDFTHTIKPYSEQNFKLELLITVKYEFCSLDKEISIEKVNISNAKDGEKRDMYFSLIAIDPNIINQIKELAKVKALDHVKEAQTENIYDQ